MPRWKSFSRRSKRILKDIIDDRYYPDTILEKKEADAVNRLIRAGLIEKQEGKFKATDFGRSAFYGAMPSREFDAVMQRAWDTGHYDRYSPYYDVFIPNEMEIELDESGMIPKGKEFIRKEKDFLPYDEPFTKLVHPPRTGMDALNKNAVIWPTLRASKGIAEDFGVPEGTPAPLSGYYVRKPNLNNPINLPKEIPKNQKELLEDAYTRHPTWRKYVEEHPGTYIIRVKRSRGHYNDVLVSPELNNPAINLPGQQFVANYLKQQADAGKLKGKTPEESMQLARDAMKEAWVIARSRHVIQNPNKNNMKTVAVGLGLILVAKLLIK